MPTRLLNRIGISYFYQSSILMGLSELGPALRCRTTEISIKLKTRHYSIKTESNGTIYMAVVIFLLKILPIILKA